MVIMLVCSNEAGRRNQQEKANTKLDEQVTQRDREVKHGCKSSTNSETGRSKKKFLGTANTLIWEIAFASVVASSRQPHLTRALNLRIQKGKRSLRLVKSWCYILFISQHRFGAVEACWAHNPEVTWSKLVIDVLRRSYVSTGREKFWKKCRCEIRLSCAWGASGRKIAAEEDLMIRLWRGGASGRFNY